MKTTNKFLLGILAAGALTLNSCKKEETVVTKNESTKNVTFNQVAAKQAVNNEATFKMVTFLSSVIRKANVGFKTADDDSIPCLTYTIDSSSSPRILTMDFGGTVGCKSVNGIDFSGLVEVEYTEMDIAVTGASFKATFTDFNIDNVVMNGEMTISNEGPNMAGNAVGKIATNLTTNYKTENQLEFTGINNFLFEFRPNTDVAFTGSGSGTTSGGLQFTQTITTECIFVDGCPDHFASGVLLIQSPSLPDKEIDYGAGTCDNQATLTENGSTTNITLQ